MSNNDSYQDLNGSEIAVIGMACRFPGARNVETFWELLRDGTEAITFLKDEEIEKSLVDPVEPGDPNYVKAAAILDDVDKFDASFFGLTPREAEVMDPQHRLFIECAWEAMENAGYDGETYKGQVGVFAGARTNTYLFNLFSNRDSIGSLGSFEIGLGNDLAFLPTRVSYKLNLRGPSYAVHTACSTSLVAVHLACQSLLIDECQMALAGGVAINVPQKVGYLYTRGGISSPDGHCRAFDEKAQGTLFGSGVGVVMLKRLEDALNDGDTIHAVIKGSAVNNDGASKASFTAPSVQGQTYVISEAIANAGIDPETITYVETHGTGTALGDPIEIRGLTKAFHMNGGPKNFCALGSVKSNLGHLDAAAGIASFIKTVLALKHKMIPPSLHFNTPNPNIDLPNTPFYVNSQLKAWPSQDLSPRRAGVSAFGIGGTNAHVIVEEAPDFAPSRAETSSSGHHLLVLSAKTAEALDASSLNLAQYLRHNPQADLRDVSYTLQVGRRAFSHRRIVVASSAEAASQALESREAGGAYQQTHYQEEREVPVVFMFPGGGAAYAGMGRGLYEVCEEYRRQVDECSLMLVDMLGCDLREVLLADDSRREEVEAKLRGTRIGLPALFVVEYALAQQMMKWGLKPEVMIGHSLGEYVAATVAGVFKVEDALRVVESRGRLMEKMRKGGMLGVGLSEEEAKARMERGMSIAAVNGPRQCVMSGESEAIERMAEKMEREGVEYQRVRIEVAAHSEMVEEIREEFETVIRGMELREPGIEMMSNVSGKVLRGEEAKSWEYWGRHLRGTVRYWEGMEEILKEKSRVMVEVGPGQGLSSMVKMARGYDKGRGVIGMMRHAKEEVGDEEVVAEGIGKLWLRGVEVGWEEMREGERRRRIGLPTYPFERQRFWIDANSQQLKVEARQSAQGKEPDVTDWFYIPSWKRTLPLATGDALSDGEEQRHWLVFSGTDHISELLLERLELQEQDFITVSAGRQFERKGEDSFTVNPDSREDFDTLITELKATGKTPTDIVHLWSLTPEDEIETGIESFQQAQGPGFYSLLFLAQAIGDQGISDPIHLWVLTNKLQEVESGDVSRPEKATMLGPCKVIPQEYQNITSHCIDLPLAESGGRRDLKLIDYVMGEFSAKPREPMIAFRGNRRWVQLFEPQRLSAESKGVRRLRDKGVYLITGGLGGVGLLLAQHLAQTVQARLILAGRTGLPERASWEDWLSSHDEDDDISYKIRKVLELESFGAEVVVASADVANEDQMRALFEAIDNKFERLDGVIHAAGVTSGTSVFTPIAGIGAAEARAQFQPKVVGVYVIEKLLRGRKLDFCVMTSSNSSVLGGMGFVAYSAANAFMDAFASSSSKSSGFPWISSSWDPWPEETKKYTGVQTSMDRYTMTPEESVDAFQRVVTMIPDSHVVVATGDLPARLDLWIKREHAGDDSASAAHPRPLIQSVYVEPRDDREMKIADIWQQLLGVEQVGINDNFFDLGGHSLLATRMAARLRDTFQIELPLQKFFQSPTVAGLAQSVAAIQAQNEDKQDQEKADILSMLANLSDEEAEMELLKRMNSTQ